MTVRRVRGQALMAALLLSACSGASDDTSSRVRPPTPAPQVGASCIRLAGALPRRLDGRRRTTVAPKSPFTAAWGNPPVVLRCGVASPNGLTSTSDVIEVNGVSWFLVETKAAYVFTAVGRQVFVEARVPTSVPREAATAPLVDLARPVAQTIPLEQADGAAVLPRP